MEERGPRDRWRRFTILDASLLTGSIAVGLALAGPGDAAWWLAPGLQTAAYLFSGLAVGSLIGLPTIMAGQWAFRGRRLRPTTGEALGLAFVGSWSIAFVMVTSFRQGALPLILGIIALDLCISLAALLRIGIGILGWFLRRKGGPSPCWTDDLGVISCLLGGLWLVVSASGLGEL